MERSQKIQQEQPVTVSTYPVQLLSLNDTATLLGLSVWTVRKMVSSGRMACVRLGRRVLIDTREIDRLISNASSKSAVGNTEQNG